MGCYGVEEMGKVGMRLGLRQLHRSLPPHMTNRERTSQLELLDFLGHFGMVPERMRKGLNSCLP